MQQGGPLITLQLVRNGRDHLAEQLVGLRLPAGLLEQRHQVLGQLRIGRRGSQRQFDFAAGRPPVPRLEPPLRLRNWWIADGAHR